MTSREAYKGFRFSKDDMNALLACISSPAPILSLRTFQEYQEARRRMAIHPRSSSGLVLPTLRTMLWERGHRPVSILLDPKTDVVRVCSAEGKEAWVSKILYLDALTLVQAHGSEPELAQGLYRELYQSARVEIPYRTAGEAVPQPGTLAARVEETVRLGQQLLRGRAL